MQLCCKTKSITARHVKALFMITIFFVILTELTATTTSTAIAPATTTTTTKILCPPGKHLYTIGSATTCEVCPYGFFAVPTASKSTKSVSCIAHTKCPPGKYTKTAGSTTAQPACEVCAPGFFKASQSISSTCAGAPSRDGMSHCYLSI